MTVQGPMTPAQTRVVDPILTRIALGYRMPGLVGETLFPRVPVELSGGQVLQFGKEDFMQYATRRSWGGRTARASFGYAGVKYALFEDSIDVPIPREMQRDASVMPGINLGSKATRKGSNIIQLSLERDQAAIATDPANFGANTEALAGAAKWSNAACDPRTSIEGAREAVRGSIGRYPNTLVLGVPAFNALRDNVILGQHFQYTTKESLTPEMIAAFFHIPKVSVAEGITSDDDGVFSDIWGNNAVFAYTELGDIDQATPSFGMTYTMTGHPLVEVPYWDPEVKSWVYGNTMERLPVMTALIAGYLIQTPA